MTAALFTLALVLTAAALFVSTLVAILAVIGAWRDRRWRRERQRMAGYHERMAAQNGRPYTDAVVEVSIIEPPR